MFTFALALSYHVGAADYDFNSIHPHIRYTTEQNYIAGVYYNSEYNVSFYGGKKFEYMGVDLELGLVSGYYDTILPYARVVKDGFYIAPTTYGDDYEPGLVIGYEVGF